MKTHIRKFLLPVPHIDQTSGFLKFIRSEADVQYKGANVRAFREGDLCYVCDKPEEGPPSYGVISVGEFMQLLTTARHVITYNRYIVSGIRGAEQYIDEFEGNLQNVVVLSIHFGSAEECAEFDISKAYSKCSLYSRCVDVSDIPAFTLKAMRGNPHGAITAYREIADEVSRHRVGN